MYFWQADAQNPYYLRAQDMVGALNVFAASAKDDSSALLKIAEAAEGRCDAFETRATAAGHTHYSFEDDRVRVNDEATRKVPST